MQDTDPVDDGPLNPANRRSFLKKAPLIVGAALLVPSTANALPLEHEHMLGATKKVDTVYTEAIAILLIRYKSGGKSVYCMVSFLQRYLIIGHSRALSIVEKLEKKGMVSRSDESRSWRINDTIASFELSVKGPDLE